MKRKKLEHIKESIWFNRGSKSFAAKLLSQGEYKITRSDLNNIEKRLDKLDREFYQSKTTKIRYKNKPGNYSTKNYRKFNDASPVRKSALKVLNKYLSELPLPEYLLSKEKEDFYRNAVRHRGNVHYVLMDIKSFFPNCTFDMIKDFFVKDGGLKLKPDLADRMAKLVTRPKSKNSKVREVPQGFPTSPLICFFAYKYMFDEINALAQKHNLTFTVYVDDLVFSSKVEFNKDMIIEKVIQILGRYGHTAKREKCKCIDINIEKAPVITGIFVKRWKIRASSKIYNKMYRAYTYLSSNKINDENTYMQMWKRFVKLNGLMETINYIEKKTIDRRKNIIEYIKKNKKNYLLSISPNDKKFKNSNWKKLIYEAYKNNQLKTFYEKYKDKFFYSH